MKIRTKNNIKINQKRSPELWKPDRKDFIKTLLATGILSQLPWIGLKAQHISSNSLLSATQITILSSVQEILFPSGEEGPGASEIHATDYFLWVISDEKMDPDEIKYMSDGIGWVNETAQEIHAKPYNYLNQAKKEELISIISKEDWGESWLSVILSFIFEALLADPQYGGNPDGIGWAWLSYIPGQPRPEADQLYPKILSSL